MVINKKVRFCFIGYYVLLKPVVIVFVASVISSHVIT